MIHNKVDLIHEKGIENVSREELAKLQEELVSITTEEQIYLNKDFYTNPQSIDFLTVEIDRRELIEEINAINNDEIIRSLDEEKLIDSKTRFEFRQLTEKDGELLEMIDALLDKLEREFAKRNLY